MPRTLIDPVSCSGIGLHSGATATVTLRPARPGTGIVFRRTDSGETVPAAYDRVGATVLSTALCAATGAPVVGTVEHLMAAVAACRLDDLVVETDAAEMPILDGSAAAWMLLIDCAGIRERPGASRRIRVLRTVRVGNEEAWAQLEPEQASGMSIALSIEFPDNRLSRQDLRTADDEARFRDDLAVARTFTFTAEIEALRAAGLARGGSLGNAVVIAADGPLNPGGYRDADECVRHKALDAIGDLALAGAPILGRFSGSRSGHRLNNELLRALFADGGNWEFAVAPAQPGPG